MARIDVRSDSTDVWLVVPDGAVEPAGTYQRQRDAELEARQLVQQRGGGEVVIHSRTGRITEVQQVQGRESNGQDNGKHWRPLRAILPD